jgi:cobalamin biosynthetic protein CobC
MLLEPWLQAAHGSDLQRALSLYGGKAEEWLDLSSAVSPFSWVCERAQPNPGDSESRWLSADALHHLPAPAASLDAALRDYYGETGLLVAGSQQAIRALPQCFAAAQVWLLRGSYGEHLSSWQQQGHTTVEKTAAEIRQAFSQSSSSASSRGSRASLPQLLILVNPGNPGAEYFTPDELRQWAEQLAKKQGWLICDEAFMDASTECSLLGAQRPVNAIVLRSLGKFFGLAGLRAGFVFASEKVLATLASRIGPWAVNGVAMQLLPAILRDTDWQRQQCLRLQELRQRMRALCAHLPQVGDTPLFITLESPQAALWQQQLAGKQIWTRLFMQQQRLRLGWPDSEAGWQRLEKALMNLAHDGKE